MACAIKATLTGLLLTAAVDVSAANIYTKGSIPSQMFNVVSPVVGQMVTPIFIRGDQPAEFGKQINPAAQQSAGVSEATLSYYSTHLEPTALANGITGYAISGYAVPGNEKHNRTCAIVISSGKQMQTTTTMFHEAVHCKNFMEIRDNPAAWELANSMNAPELGMTGGQYFSLFHEVLAAYMQVAYKANQGLEDGIGMVMQASWHDKNTAVSVGYRTARNALKRCAVKDACPTDTVSMINLLANSPGDRADMLLDLKELHEAAVASGFVVQDR